MKSVSEEYSYTQSPEQVRELITAGKFQVEVIEVLGGHDATIVEERAESGSVHLVTSQKTAVELPGFAKKLIPANSTVVQTFDWDPPASDGSSKGTWSATVKSAPISIGGETELLGTPDGGTIHRYTGQIKANVPLIGGKLEQFALDNLRTELAKTADHTRRRLEED